MASEVAKQMAARLFMESGAKPQRAARLVLAFDGDDKFRGHSGWSELPVAGELDVTLQEVRKVLHGLSVASTTNIADSCWCYADTRERTQRMQARDEHWPICQRARRLAERLEVK